LGEASVKGHSRSWKKDGIAKNFGCGTLPFAVLRVAGRTRASALHNLSVFFYAGVMAGVTVGLFSWLLQPFLDGVFAEFHLQNDGF
jgi:hypothetical protein